MLMDLSPRYAFGALVIAGAGFLSGCGKAVDPMQAPPQPVAATAAVPQLAPYTRGEPLQADVAGRIMHNNASAFSREVHSIEACANYGREITYMVNRASSSNSDSYVSCTNSEGLPVARFICSPEKASCAPAPGF